MFSSRVPSDLAPNRLAQALAKCRAEGRAIVDLTESNPTRAGFDYSPDLLASLGDRNALTYSPEPLGLAAARRAIAADYRRRGTTVAPERIALTASTSEAYSLLFKVLCDAGDEVLTPRPSYPLFEHLTRLDAVVARPYDIEYHGTWAIDSAGIERSITERTRAVLLVSPNNPTGSFVKAGELDAVAALCRPRGIAVIADEVFADYAFAADQASHAASVAARQDVLSFSLGGLSKSVGLPQVKLAWIAASGPDTLARAAIARLELACDTYLSVSTPVQLAVSALFDGGRTIRRQIQARVSTNYRSMVEGVAVSPACRILPAEGGWYAVLQVPTFQPEEDLVLDLLTKHGVLVHPGYFFDFARESFLVVSLLPPEPTFAEGVSRILRHFAGASGPRVSAS